MQVVYFGKTPGTDGGVGENKTGKEGKPTQGCVMELGSSLRVRGGSILLGPSKELCRLCLRTIHSRDNVSLEQERGWEHLPTDFHLSSVRGCSLGY